MKRGTGARVPRSHAAMKNGELGDIKIASPCEASWDEMTGDDRVRHCGQCQRSVYNLSEMTADEVAALLGARGRLPCVRLYQREDGTVLTREDCPVGVERVRLRMRKLAAAFAVALGFLAAGAWRLCMALAGSPQVVREAEVKPATPRAAAPAEPAPGPPVSLKVASVRLKRIMGEPYREREVASFELQCRIVRVDAEGRVISPAREAR